MQAYDKALELNPDVSDVWHRKGGTLDNLGRYEEALQAIDKALELNPDDSVAWHRKGIAFRKLGLYQEALQVLQHYKVANLLIQHFRIGGRQHRLQDLRLAVIAHQGAGARRYRKGRKTVF